MKRDNGIKHHNSWYPSHTISTSFTDSFQKGGLRSARFFLEMTFWSCHIATEKFGIFGGGEAEKDLGLEGGRVCGEGAKAGEGAEALGGRGEEGKEDVFGFEHPGRSEVGIGGEVEGNGGEGGGGVGDGAEARRPLGVRSVGLELLRRVPVLFSVCGRSKWVLSSFQHLLESLSNYFARQNYITK